MNREELEQHIHEQVDKKIDSSWNQTLVFPYVQKHEFEGLLFSDMDAFERAIQVLGVTRETIEKLRNIRKQFQTPEDINDNSETAPSKRIKKLIPRYNKKVHGPLIAAETGLDVIRAECPLFDEWVTRLESLATRRNLDERTGEATSLNPFCSPETTRRYPSCAGHYSTWRLRMKHQGSLANEPGNVTEVYFQVYFRFTATFSTK